MPESPIRHGGCHGHAHGPPGTLLTGRRGASSHRAPGLRARQALKLNYLTRIRSPERALANNAANSGPGTYDSNHPDLRALAYAPTQRGPAMVRLQVESGDAFGLAIEVTDMRFIKTTPDGLRWPA